MKRTRLIALLLTFCIVLTLTACGAETTTTSSAADETASGGDSAEHEPITLMDAQRDYSNLIALVHEKYPEINIEILPYRGRNMSAFCKQQLETGIMPDIYSTTQAWDTDLQKEYLVDLSDYAVSELYSTARLSEYIVDGSLYLLPFDYSVSGILYNKTLLEKIGIDVPQSFTQLVNETIPALNANDIKIANCLMDLPGTGFQYFFNVNATGFMNSMSGREWRNSFTDVNSDTFAAGNEDVAECVDYFNDWIDCGIIRWEEGISGDYSATLNDFMAGNAAFLVGAVHRFTQNDDGTGDQYGLMPYLSPNGDQNAYITSPTRLYGLSKKLEEPGNEQKLEDAMHVLEVLSTNEGYLAMNGENSTNMCSIADFKLAEDSPYAEAMELISKGFAMNQVYTGWDNYLASFGNAAISWIKGESTGEEAIKVLDDGKHGVQENGPTVYAVVTEKLDTVQAAQLSGQMFLEATGADAALISYNVYSPDVPALQENSYGANGWVLPGDMTEEYITVFLPTGWYDTLQTAQLTGSKIKEMAAAGCDPRGTGFKYPYVFMTADGNALEDDEIYTVVLCGYDASEKEALGLTDTGIVGLDAAKEYLLKAGEISAATLDESLVQPVGASD